MVSFFGERVGIQLCWFKRLYDFKFISNLPRTLTIIIGPMVIDYESKAQLDGRRKFRRE